MLEFQVDTGSGQDPARNTRRCMFSFRPAFRSDRSGQALAIVALGLAGLIGAAALAIDIGMLYSARAEAQRAADAAALAGASAFLDFDPTVHPTEAHDTALARAYDYAGRETIMNSQILAPEVTPWIVLDSQKVRVQIRRTTLNLFFAKIFGHTFGTVKAVAAAEAIQAGTAKCLKPFAIPDMWNMADPLQDLYVRPGSPAPIWDFDRHLYPDVNPAAPCTQQGNKWVCPPEVWEYSGNYNNGVDGYNSTKRDGAPDWEGNIYHQDEGRRILIKANDPQMTPAPSYFFPWRQPGASGAKDYLEAMKGCVDGTYSLGQPVDLDSAGVVTEPGNMLGPTGVGIDYLIDQDPGAYWEETCDLSGNCTGLIKGSAYPGETSPRVIVIPLIDPSTISNGMTTMTFINFAQFFLEDPAVVYANVQGNPNQLPVTGRLMKYVSGLFGPQQGNLVKRLRLIE